MKQRLTLELLLVFVAMPVALAVLKPGNALYAILWITSILSLLWLLRHGYNFKQDWNWQAVTKPVMRSIFVKYIPLAIALTLFAYFAIPEHWFRFPLTRPLMWMAVMMFYPILSVIPQEILFRSFFFRRYPALFTTERSMLLASALTFGWMHVFLHNWVAVVFSALGGIIFARTYQKTNSLAAVTIEHALYGCTIFTLGMGYYFYHGVAVK